MTEPPEERLRALLKVEQDRGGSSDTAFAAQTNVSRATWQQFKVGRRQHVGIRLSHGVSQRYPELRALAIECLKQRAADGKEETTQ